ncbi:MAG: Kdo hydroxylase family protein [Alphaproteobacteria bacterium]|nr:Kdo hydroxylase family protein [Alphaproteobacteria bacterium]
MDVLHAIDSDAWAGPFASDEQGDAVGALEQGSILYFPHLNFTLRSGEERLLMPRVLDHGGKNVSLEPDGTLSHATLSGGTKDCLRGMMVRFSDAAAALVETLFPTYRGRVDLGPTSFRPVEIEGRKARPLADDTRLHVDAFPSVPMNGRRILRVFANVNPDGKARLWNVGEPFADMARNILPRAKPPIPGAAWFYAAVGATVGRRTPYDELMLGLHHGAKLDLAYQAKCPKTPIDFPPGAVWMCYTDQVVHATLKGQHALEQTFYVPVGAMADPSRSPLRVLERMTGRRLV